ncbi:hypothetical protein [Xanthomonas theicola]|uniref:Uncharacterized protein n=1 Tax=Xanthomonas theicola TaxID=56464 RepID=A0A2S6ZLX1_9XANT|nr:hypothetical protein [Xanthomonas theicola]PPT93235.1 hypothetical protein XthCFBP4691_01080 [Xanthomonas theicola]QNH24830.1 hypothetical protein G4Q83_08820 [Xanthomonas theicola]
MSYQVPKLVQDVRRLRADVEVAVRLALERLVVLRKGLRESHRAVSDRLLRRRRRMLAARHEERDGEQEIRRVLRQRSAFVRRAQPRGFHQFAGASLQGAVHASSIQISIRIRHTQKAIPRKVRYA